MKCFIIYCIITLLLTTSLVLISCASPPLDKQKDEFMEISEYSLSTDETLTLVVHLETNVVYCIYDGFRSGHMIPMVDSQGNPLCYNMEEN